MQLLLWVLVCSSYNRAIEKVADLRSLGGASLSLAVHHLARCFAATTLHSAAPRCSRLHSDYDHGLASGSLQAVRSSFKPGRQFDSPWRTAATSLLRNMTDEPLKRHIVFSFTLKSMCWLGSRDLFSRASIGLTGCTDIQGELQVHSVSCQVSRCSSILIQAFGQSYNMHASEVIFYP